LDREIHEAGWTFFCLAGEIKATVFGFDAQKVVRRAVKRILAKLKSERFNSLEITQVASKRFLGLPYATVSACSRHIQESVFLFRGKRVSLPCQEPSGVGPSKIGCPDQGIGLARGKERPVEEMKTAKCGNDLESVIV
jgi:hypothetical protein